MSKRLILFTFLFALITGSTTYTPKAHAIAGLYASGVGYLVIPGAIALGVGGGVGLASCGGACCLIFNLASDLNHDGNCCDCCPGEVCNIACQIGGAGSLGCAATLGTITAAVGLGLLDQQNEGAFIFPELTQAQAIQLGLSADEFADYHDFRKDLNSELQAIQKAAVETQSPLQNPAQDPLQDRLNKAAKLWIAFKQTHSEKYQKAISALEKISVAVIAAHQVQEPPFDPFERHPIT